MRYPLWESFSDQRADKLGSNGPRRTVIKPVGTNSTPAIAVGVRNRRREETGSEQTSAPGDAGTEILRAGVRNRKRRRSASAVPYYLEGPKTMKVEARPLGGTIRRDDKFVISGDSRFYFTRMTANPFTGNSRVNLPALRWSCCGDFRLEACRISRTCAGVG